MPATSSSVPTAPRPRSRRPVALITARCESPSPPTRPARRAPRSSAASTRSSPAIAVELVESPTLEGLQQLVADHETDAAFAWLPILHDELEHAVVFSEPKSVGMHPEHRLAAQDQVQAKELEAVPIVSSWEHYSPATLAHWLGPFRTERTSIDLQATSVDECLSLVARGLAVYVVPESAQRFYGRPDVVYRPLVGVEPVSVALVWHRDTQNAGVDALAEVTRAVAGIQNQAR